VVDVLDQRQPTVEVRACSSVQLVDGGLLACEPDVEPIADTVDLEVIAEVRRGGREWFSDWHA